MATPSLFRLKLARTRGQVEVLCILAGSKVLDAAIEFTCYYGLNQPYLNNEFGQLRVIRVCCCGVHRYRCS